MKIKRRKLFRVLFQILGLALFAVILSRVDLGAIARSYRGVTAAECAIGCVILLAFTLVKGLRWRSIAAAQGVRMSVQRSFKVYASSLYLGIVTPGHVGDFAKAWYVRNAGLSIGRALWSSILDRLFDLLFLVLVGWLSLLFLPGIIENQMVVTSLAVAAVGGASAVCFFRRDLLKRLARRLFAGAAGEGLRGDIDRAMQEGLEDFGLVTPRLAAGAALLTAVAWILHYAFFGLFAHALGIEISPALVIVCVSVAIFVSLVPVSISGLGTRDIALILVFSRIGLSREAAVTFSSAWIVANLFQGIVGLICWVTSPFHPRPGSFGEEA